MYVISLIFHLDKIHKVVCLTEFGQDKKKLHAGSSLSPGVCDKRKAWKDYGYHYYFNKRYKIVYKSIFVYI